MRKTTSRRRKGNGTPPRAAVPVEPEAPAQPTCTGSQTTTTTAGGALSKPWIAVLVLVLTIGAAYANGLGGPFVFDDVPSIVENPSIRHLGSWRVLAAPPDAITTSGRPIVNLTLALNYAVGGLAVEGYHVVNLALHILAALTLFGLVRRTLLLPSMRERFASAATELALAVALLWAIHPLQTESVTYIVQRAEALVGLFYLLTLYCLVRSGTAKRGGVWSMAAIGACVLGMGSKEVMVTAPVVCLLFDRIFMTGSFANSLRRRSTLWLGLASTWGLLAILHVMSANRGGSAGFGLGMTVWEYARTQFGCILHYLRLAFWPSPLVIDYGYLIAHHASEIVPYALGVLVLLAATVVALVRWPTWGFLGFWFFAILAPSSSIVPLPGQTEAEHRMYLPLAAVVALVVMATYGTARRVARRTGRTLGGRGTAVAAVTAVALAFGWMTLARNRDYQSELVLWNGAVENVPLNDRAYLSRGNAYRVKSQYDAAIADFDRCIALNPHYVKAYVSRGIAYSETHRYEEATRDFDQAVRLKPNQVDAHNGRGSIYGYQGQYDAAIAEFNRAIGLAPEAAEAYFNRGNAHTAKGEVEAAFRDYDQAITLRPNYAEAYYLRGVIHDGKGQVDAALKDYDKAIAFRPDFAEAYSNRCSAYDYKGQPNDALEDCDKAIALRPDFAEPYTNRGNAHQSKGQYDAAIRDYDKAIALKPALVAAYQNRALAYLQTRDFDKAWADVRKLRTLGAAPAPGFLENLIAESGRSE